jgi:hypothetical protein
MKVQPFIVDPISVGYLIGPKGFMELQIVDYWEVARAAGGGFPELPGFMAARSRLGIFWC